MRFMLKKQGTYFLLVLLLFSSLYFYRQYHTYKEAEHQSYSLQINGALTALNSAHYRAEALYANWDATSKDSIIVDMEAISLLLNSARENFFHLDPHLSIRRGTKPLHANDFSELVMQYGNIATAWKNALLKGQSEAEIREKLGVLASDLDILRRMDGKVLTTYDKDQLWAYWRETVFKLKLDEVIGEYRITHSDLWEEGAK